MSKHCLKPEYQRRRRQLLHSPCWLAGVALVVWLNVSVLATGSIQDTLVSRMRGAEHTCPGERDESVVRPAALCPSVVRSGGPAGLVWPPDMSNSLARLTELGGGEQLSPGGKVGRCDTPSGAAIRHLDLFFGESRRICWGEWVELMAIRLAVSCTMLFCAVDDYYT